jgi:hypothetical protein
MSSANLVMNLASSLNILSSIMDTLWNKNMDPWEKFKALLTQLPMLTMTLVGAY